MDSALLGKSKASSSLNWADLEGFALEASSAGGLAETFGASSRSELEEITRARISSVAQGFIGLSPRLSQTVAARSELGEVKRVGEKKRDEFGRATFLRLNERLGESEASDFGGLALLAEVSEKTFSGEQVLAGAEVKPKAGAGGGAGSSLMGGAGRTPLVSSRVLSLKKAASFKDVDLEKGSLRLVRPSIFGLEEEFKGRELPSFRKRTVEVSQLAQDHFQDDLDRLAGAMNCIDTTEYFEQGTPYPKTPHPKYNQEKRADGLYYFVPKNEGERELKRRK